MRRWVRALRRRWYIPAGLVVIAAAGVATVLLWPAGPAGGNDDAEPSSRPTSMSAAEAAALAAELTDPDPAVVAGVLADPARASYQAAPAALLPAGDTLSIDAASFQPGSADGYGTVAATASGPQPASFVLLVVEQDGTWRVLGSVRQP